MKNNQIKMKREKKSTEIENQLNVLRGDECQIQMYIHLIFSIWFVNIFKIIFPYRYRFFFLLFLCAHSKANYNSHIPCQYAECWQQHLTATMMGISSKINRNIIIRDSLYRVNNNRVIEREMVTWNKMPTNKRIKMKMTKREISGMP